MKRLTRLRKTLLTLNGVPYEEPTGLWIDADGGVVPKGTEGATPQQRMITPANLIANEIAHSESAFDAMLMMKVAKKFHEAGDALDLEDAEYGVAEYVISNNVNLRAFAKAACLEALGTASDTLDTGDEKIIEGLAAGIEEQAPA